MHTLPCTPTTEWQTLIRWVLEEQMQVQDVVLGLLICDSMLLHTQFYVVDISGVGTASMGA